MSQPALLVVTSEASLRRWLLEQDLAGFDVLFHDDVTEALAEARRGDVWLFLWDARGSEGVVEGVIRRLRSLEAEPEILILSERPGEMQAEVPPERVLVAPPDPDTLAHQVRRLLALQRVRRESGIVGGSSALREVIATVAQVAPLDVPVLIHGESGTGKELVARALHQGSRRAERAFVSVNVGSLAESLLESELFGHEKGAFTGAVARREGVFERANGGTLFLDEVGEMSLTMQVKLLRVLETREFSRVGGSSVLETDVRLLAATHRDLEERIAAGRFRSDLYYRLKVVKIDLPPLRERPEDIPALVNLFLAEANRNHGLALKGMTKEALDRFVRYAWPGNVRELRNIVSSMSVLARGNRLGVEDLPAELQEGADRGRSLPMAFEPGVGAGPEALLTSSVLALMQDMREVLRRLERIDERLAGGTPEGGSGWEASEAEFTPLGTEVPQDLAGAERAMIQAALRQHGGNRRKAAEQLGISERTLYRKLKSDNVE